MDLTPQDISRYAWQLSIPGLGEAGQKALRNARVLVSRVGGVGGTVAYFLAAAGVGKLVLAHAGLLRENDLNRQLLMTHDWIGKPRVECAARRIKELNPHVEVEAVAENVSAASASHLVSRADVVVDSAPLFEERLAMNAAAVAQRKPLVHCAMYEMELALTVVVPGKTPCLACLYPETPPAWKREFPVLGSVAGTVGALAATEVVKVLAGLGEPLTGRMLTADLRDMSFRTARICRREGCRVCGGVA